MQRLFIASYKPTADQERADWTGETAKAQFQGAAAEDRRYVAGAPIARAFGRKAKR